MACDPEEVYDDAGRQNVDAQHPSQGLRREQKVQRRPDISTEATVAMTEENSGAHVGGEFIGESGDANRRNLQGKQQLRPPIAAGLPPPEIHALHNTPGKDGDGKHCNEHAIRAMFMREVIGHLHRRKDA